ncbi:hypothetical protein SSU98_1724 [Streptococcus suis 98HAH33]|nr:hypothetical protein SSU05_1712 [Streptococcus suis 05ZYH33]ABP92883.1 hypothetical protein SSU98_1724 [Streptococcus suis 98HAH33]
MNAPFLLLLSNFNFPTAKSIILIFEQSYPTMI